MPSIAAPVAEVTEPLMEPDIARAENRALDLAGFGITAFAAKAS
jgi:hypothetical protein